MNQVSIFWPRAGSCSPNVNRNDQSWATIRTVGNLLAAASLTLGAVFNARLPALLEQRNSPVGWGLRPLIKLAMLLTAFGLGWCGGLLEFDREAPAGGAAVDSVAGRIIGIEFDDLAIDAVVERIIRIESGGDPNATNNRSSAMGLGQFLDETWLDLIRNHRPDLAKGRSMDEMLELRRDGKLAREITMRFTKQNAAMLRKRGLPVTPGTLYLAHFAGGAGAVAILSSLEEADAASVMAGADATGRTKREKIVKANSFLERFTVADLRNWADRKMRPPGP